jgi:hypothetical protein
MTFWKWKWYQNYFLNLDNNIVNPQQKYSGTRQQKTVCGVSTTKKFKYINLASRETSSKNETVFEKYPKRTWKVERRKKKKEKKIHENHPLQ